MNERTKSQKGSPARDSFKRAHKEINKSFYASDCDLCFISFEPEGVVAYIDYKKPGDSVTRTEEILYNEWTKTKPVFVIEGPSPEQGPFKISRYETGNILKFVCALKDWKEFEEWEDSLRRDFKKNEMARRSGAKPLHNNKIGKPLQPLQISSRLANP